MFREFAAKIGGVVYITALPNLMVHYACHRETIKCNKNQITYMT